VKIYGAADGVVAVASGSLYLSWTAPASSSNVSNAPAGYNVYQGTTAGGESATPVNGSALLSTTSVTIPGLTNGTTYYFTVKAVNALGASSASVEVSNAPAGVPGAPSGVAITAGSKSASLTWTAPASNGSDIIGYNVYQYSTATAAAAGALALNGTSTGESAYAGSAYINGLCASSPATPVNLTQCDANNALSTSNLITTTSYVVTGLTNASSYYFVVTAVNAIGESTAVVASATPTIPGAVTTAPTSVTVAQGVSSSLVLSWASNTGATVGFNVYMGTTAGGESTTPVNALPIANASGGNSYAVYGLTAGSSYYFTIKAVNTTGSSAASTEVFGTAAASAPSKITGVTATSQNTQTLITWTAPASNGSTISAYTATATSAADFIGGTTTTTTGCANVAVTYCTITGLTNGITYTITVKATNAVGASTASTGVTVVPAPTTPDKPTSVTVSISGTTATLGWTNGGNEGGIMTGVTVYMGTASGAETPYNSYAAGTTSATIPVSVSGTYYFYVVDSSTLGVGAKSAEVSAVSGGTTAGAASGLAQTEYRSGGSTASSVLLTWAAPASTGGATVTSYYIFPVVNGSIGRAGLVAGTKATTADAATAATTLAVGACPSDMSTFTWLVTGTGIAANTTATCSGTTLTLSAATTAAIATGATLTFYAPLAKGAANVGYTNLTTAQIDNTYGLQISSTTGVGSALITGLNGGAAYQFMVVAVNAFGASVSTPSNLISFYAPAVSGVPGNVAATAGAGTVSVTWTGPVNTDGSTAVAYNVAATLSGAITPATIAQIQSPLSGSGELLSMDSAKTVLTFDTAIPVGVGIGSPVTVSAVGSGSLAVPASTKVTAVTATTVTISAAMTGTIEAGVARLKFGDLFTATSTAGVVVGMTAFGGSAGTTSLGTVVYVDGTNVGFSLGYNSGTVGRTDATTFTTASATNGSTGTASCPSTVTGAICIVTAGTTATFSNLSSSAKYTFQVSSSSDAVTYSAFSTASVASTPGAAPITPTFTTTNPSSGVITVTITSSMTGIVKWTATATDTVTGTSATCTNTTGTTCSLVGLSNGDLQLIIVTQSNAAGSTSSLSSYGNALTYSYGKPSVAGAPTVSVGSAQGSGTSATYPVTVSWKTPSNLGGATNVAYTVSGTNTVTGVVTQYPVKQNIYVALQVGTTAQLTALTTGSTSLTSTTVVDGVTQTVSACTGVYPGMVVTGGGIATGTEVVSCTGTTLVLNNAATAHASETLTVTGGGTDALANASVVARALNVLNGSGSYCVAADSALLNGTDNGANAELTSATTTCTIYGITGTSTVPGVGDKWSFAVSSDNTAASLLNYGASAYSAASTAVTIAKANTVPSAPVQATLGVASGALTVSWTAPTNTGGSISSNAITGYNVYIGTSAGGESSTPANGSIPVTGTTITLTGLTNGTKYYVIVKAVNLVGSSVASNEKYGTPSTAALAPTSVVATPAATSVALSWSAPSVTGGAAIAGYQVYAWADSLTLSSLNPSNATIVTGTSYTVTGLATGTKYDFLVVAVNAAGVSAASTLVSATPAAVAAVVVVPMPKNVTVSFPASPVAKSAAQIKKMTAAQKATYNRQMIAANAAATKISAEGLIALNNYSLNSVDGSKVTITANGATAAIAAARANAIANYLVQSGAALHYNIVTAVGTGLNTAVMVTTAA